MFTIPNCCIIHILHHLRYQYFILAISRFSVSYLQSTYYILTCALNTYLLNFGDTLIISTHTHGQDCAHNLLRTYPLPPTLRWHLLTMPLCIYCCPPTFPASINYTLHSRNRVLYMLFIYTHETALSASAINTCTYPACLHHNHTTPQQ